MLSPWHIVCMPGNQPNSKTLRVGVFYESVVVFFFFFFSGVGEGSGRQLVGIQEMEINHLRLVDWIELVWQTGPDC